MWDLYEYPLNQEVVQEGDYYADGVTLAENIPWLYTVADSGFSFAAAIANKTAIGYNYCG